MRSSSAPASAYSAAIVLIVPYVRAPELTLLQRLISIAYPVQDIVLLAVAVRLWRAGAQITTAFRLLTVGLLSLTGCRHHRTD